LVENNKNINNDEEKEIIIINKPPVIEGLSDLGNLSEDQWKVIFRHFRIGEHMLQRKLITISQLSDLLEEQKQTGEQLGELVVRKGIITREGLLNLLFWQHKADQVILKLLINIENK
jgi:hypothetical protein